MTTAELIALIEQKIKEAVKTAQDGKRTLKAIRKGQK